MDTEHTKAIFTLDRAYNQVLAIGDRRDDPEYEQLALEITGLARRLRLLSITTAQAMPEQSHSA